MCCNGAALYLIVLKVNSVAATSASQPEDNVPAPASLAPGNIDIRTFCCIDVLLIPVLEVVTMSSLRTSNARFRTCRSLCTGVLFLCMGLDDTMAAPATPTGITLAGTNVTGYSHTSTGMIATDELNTGDIRFIGFTCDGDDAFSIVTFEDIPSNTELYFRDAEWDGNGFISPESLLVWTSGVAVIEAGTVINFTNTTESTRGVTVGTIGGDLDIGTSDGIFCYYGTDADTPSRFLAAVGNASLASAFGSLDNTGLTDGDTALRFSDDDIGIYTNARSGYAKATYKTMVADANNWQVEDGPEVHLTPAPALPFSETPFTFVTPASLSEGAIAFVGHNSSGTDQFAFIALADIPQTTEIKFTDKEWSNVSSNLTAEGNDSDAAWIASSPVSAGTVVTVNSGSADIGSWSASLDLRVTGEALLAYQGTPPNQTFLAGLNMRSWTSTNLPSGLTAGASAIQFSPRKEGGFYNTIKTSGTVEALRTAINNEAGWTAGSGQHTFPSWTFSINASTPSLSAGDIAFIAYDLDNNRFAFVALATIPEDTEIAFTDIGWDKIDLVPDVDINVLKEQTGVWTAPAGGLTYGDVVRIQGTNVTGGGTMSGDLGDLAGGGDQVLAFQGSVTNPTFIAAMGMYTWRSGDDGVSLEEHSHMPTGLTEGQTAVQATDSAALNHGRYYGERIGLRATVLPAINTVANWETGNDPQTWWTPWYFGETPPPTLFQFR